MSLRSSLVWRSWLRGGAVLACLLLAACPQLLEDAFEERLIPPVGLISSGGTPGGGLAGNSGEPDASAAGGADGGFAGAAGTGGQGQAGAASGPDGGLGAAAGSGAGDPDAGGTPDGPGAVLRAALLHRYRFDEAGTTILDSIGTAHGTAVHAQVGAGSGKIVLNGSDGYVDLPNGLISSLTSVTLEAWVSWAADPQSSEAAWQTPFVFGSNASGEDARGAGTSYVYVTAKSLDTDGLQGGYTLSGYDDELRAISQTPLPLAANPATGTQLVLVVRGTADGGSVALYLDGAQVSASAGGQTVDLSAVADVNNWLGQSQYGSDPNFAGEILEFRIYGAALSASDIALSHSLGPDAPL